MRQKPRVKWINFVVWGAFSVSFGATWLAAQQRFPVFPALPAPPGQHRDTSDPVMKLPSQQSLGRLPNAVPTGEQIRRNGASKSHVIKCAVVEWRPSEKLPALTLVCPPSQIFAPVRVYLKLSWRAREEIPEESLRIVAEPRSQTKLETIKHHLRVWLEVANKKGDGQKAKWVEFDSLQALLFEGDGS